MDTKGIEELVANPENPRKISDFDFNNLVQSMREFGDLSGIVKNLQTGRLVGGHMRTEAAKKLGAHQVHITQRMSDGPDKYGTVALGYVLLPDGATFSYREVIWSEAKEKAANIAANRIQGEWDKDLLAKVNYELSQLENGQELLALTGQSPEELSKLLDSVGALGEGDSADDEAPPVNDVQPAVSQLGEIYQLGRHRLICGDSTDFGQVTDLLNGAESELLLTDPPYNMDYQGGGIFENDINQSFKDNVRPLTDFDPAKMFEVLEAIQPKSCICFTSKDLLYDYMTYIKTKGKNFNLLTWHKTNPIPMNNGNFLPDTEYIFYWYGKGERRFNNNIDGVDYHKYYLSEINEGRREGENEHPTIKPQGLLTKFVKICTQRGDVVLDLFGGSGSTLIACDGLDRVCYTMELDPRYCDVIRKRYAKHIGQEADWVTATPCINKAEELENATSQNVNPNSTPDLTSTET